MQHSLEDRVIAFLLFATSCPAGIYPGGDEASPAGRGQAVGEGLALTRLSRVNGVLIRCEPL